MQKLITALDELAGIEGQGVVPWLERVAFVFLVLMIIAAPHSIAATQTAWLTGMFVWIIRLFFHPRVRFKFTALDGALWIFFAWSVITSLTSYAPDISINKLRGAAVFLIFYFVLYNIRSRRTARVLAFVLIGSCMVNVLWTPIQRLIGRGVEIHGLAPDGPMAKAYLWEGDTLLEADGKKVRTPEEVLAAIESGGEITKIKFYRPDFDFVVSVKRSDLLAGPDVMSRLGIAGWKKSHNWRSSGFYGHYATYSEVLQLIVSLVMGLVVATWRRRWKEGEKGREGEREKAEKGASETNVSKSPRSPISPSPHLPISLSALLFFALAAMCLALLLTVTRASQLGFLISAAVIVLIGLGRRGIAIAGLVGIPLAIAGVLFLQQSRQVGFFDTRDESIRWRQTVWREGFDLWTSSPRNFVLGVGMDSSQRFAREWHMFDDGRLNPGHFHSTPLNLVVERGLPALLIWLCVLGIYARSLWRGLNPKSKSSPPAGGGVAEGRGGGSNPISNGILLGCLGGTVGFFMSGLVHYNLGDQEVAMMFFLLMGIGVRTLEMDGGS